MLWAYAYAPEGKPSSQATRLGRRTGAPRLAPRLELEASTRGPEFCLRVSGRLEAMALVEGLDRTLRGAQGVQILRLDLRGAQELDHLALSAVLVVLRNHAGAFQRLELHGLPPWARLRLYQSGPQGLLGPQWREVYAGDRLELHRS
ncbi:MAG: hypothetical protein AB1814_06630 [Thermodesulfobacteriota bacterium]